MCIVVLHARDGRFTFPHPDLNGESEVVMPIEWQAAAAAEISQRTMQEGVRSRTSSEDRGMRKQQQQTIHPFYQTTTHQCSGKGRILKGVGLKLALTAENGAAARACQITTKVGKGLLLMAVRRPRRRRPRRPRGRPRLQEHWQL